MTRIEVVARMTAAGMGQATMTGAMMAALDEVARCVREEGGGPPMAPEAAAPGRPGPLIPWLRPLPWWPKPDGEEPR